MSDELYKRIKEASDKIELPAYRESEWEAYEDYAKKKDKPKAMSWYAWGIGALVFLLIFSNAVWWNKSKSFEKITTTESKNVVALQEDLKSHTNSSVQVDSKDDLLLEKTVSSQQASIDQLVHNVNQLKAQISTLTASRNKNITQKNLGSFAQDQFMDINPKRSGINKENNTTGEIRKVGALNRDKNSYESDDKTNRTLSELNKSEPIFLTTDLPQLSSSAILPLNFSLHLPTAMISGFVDHKSDNNPLTFITPKSLSLILQAGYSGVANDELGYSSGLNLGIGLSTAFSSRVRLIADLQWIITSTEVDIEDQEDLGILSDVTLPNGARAKELYYDFSSIGISTGLDYMFTPKGRVRPYIGMVYSIQFAQYQDQFLEYNLNNQSLVQILPNRELDMTQYLGLRGGLDFNLFENFDASLNISLQKSLNNESILLLNLSPGIQYHF